MKPADHTGRSSRRGPITYRFNDLTTSTTRRTVVKTGAKLAYAAPLVAATMKLSSSSAFAAVSGSPVTCPDPASDPPSSYARTCSVTQACTADGTTLSGRCQDGNGDYVTAFINVNTCQPQGYAITNCNGVLVCGDHC